MSDIGDVASRYRTLCRRMTVDRPETAALLDLGRALYRWLDGTEGWLSELRPKLVPPFVLEVRTGRQPSGSGSVLLHAPWELLADELGFLAEREFLAFAPVRRMGRPGKAVADEFRLGVAFMASAPRGATDLDPEAEEAAILAATRNDIDLIVEDSGDPRSSAGGWRPCRTARRRCCTSRATGTMLLRARAGCGRSPSC